MLSLPITATNVALFPVRLVTITRLDGLVQRVAAAEVDIVNDGHTYLSLLGCDIGAVNMQLGGQVGSLQINFAHSDGGVIDTFDVNVGLYDGATVELLIADRDDLSKPGVLRFKGTVQQISFSILGHGSFDIRSQVAEAEQFIETYGPVCRTDLFSDLCQVDKTSYAQTATVVSIPSPFSAVISGLSAPPSDKYFDVGTGQRGTDIAFEIAHYDHSVTTLHTFLPICVLFAASDTLTLYPGCDKTEGADGCARFNNLINRQAESHFLGVAAAAAGGTSAGTNL
jgi:uncharacterized phage protein (TIGR02218 family)